MSKRFGTNPDELIAKDLVTELNAELSKATIIEAYTKATGVVEWSKTPPAGVSYTEHKLTFFDAMANAETEILNNAGRFNGSSVLVAGTSAAAVIRTMPGFIPADNLVAALGTHFFGTLDGKPVIRSIVLPTNEMLVISKGSGYFDNALVYSPYLPLFVSNAMDGQDHNPLKSQKAVATQAAITAPVYTLITKIKITD